MRINLLGQRNQLGGGRFYGGFVDAMTSLNLIKDSVREYAYLSPDDRAACLASSSERDINIHFVNTTNLPETVLPNPWPKLPGINVHWAIFECTVLPQPQLDWLTTADLVFVPSRWGKTVLMANGLDAEKIEVVPEGVDPNLFHPILRDTYPQDEIFRVLVVGKFEARKGFPELIDGFCQAFGGNDKVRLLLKSDSPWMKRNISEEAYEENLNELRDLIRHSGAGNIRLLAGDLTDADLFHFYNATDLLLFPSRAEGWGLPLLEAIACGLPVATTYYSGQTEFLRPIKDKCELIDFDMVPMGPKGEFGLWACAGPDAIAASLVKVRENIESYRAKAREAAAVARARFSWQRAAETCMARLSERFPETIRSMTKPPASYQSMAAPI